MDASKSFPAPLLNPWYEELRRLKERTEQPPHEGSKRLLPRALKKTRRWARRRGARGRVHCNAAWWHCALSWQSSPLANPKRSCRYCERTKAALCNLLLLFYIAASLWGKTTVNQFHQLLLQLFILCAVLSVASSSLIILLCILPKMIYSSCGLLSDPHQQRGEMC